jgi:hypothetical protein
MHPYLKIAAVSLVAYAACAAFQKNVMAIPVVGAFLPGATAA